jgi:GT2 family glycosyltransferase
MATLPSYSIAIRTLGTAGEKFRKELESICTQTVQPERVLVYIAEGYKRPGFTVGREEYVAVPKGMVAQRALRYDEIESGYILLLDDDVLLAPDSAEKMFRALVDHNADCVGADIFQNHRMPMKTIIFAALTNLVFPHRSQKWAFKVHRNGSFSYNACPKKAFYWSQSCGGPAMLWRKDTLLQTHFEDERWMDRLGFSYGEDQLETYKLHSNSGRLGVLYDSGIMNLDAQSSSAPFRKSPDYFLFRTKALLMTWWRMCYKTGKDTSFSRFLAATAFGLKSLWLFLVMCISALIKWDRRFLSAYCKGLQDGWRGVHSADFQNLPPYIQ